MLRAPLLRIHTVSGRFQQIPRAAQWQRMRCQSPGVIFQQRFYADPPKTPDQTVLPGSNSATRATDEPAPPNLTPSAPSSSSTIPAENVPKTPPTPAEAQSSSNVSATTSSGAPTGAGTASVTPSAGSGSTSTSQKPKRKPRRWRRFFLSLIILSGLGYAGGVYYSLISDNWHDFFTEYVPFGEDTVAYFEEREFRRRFPQDKSAASRAYPQVRGENKVTISGKSGMSSRVTDDASQGSDLGTKGRHTSALQDNQPARSKQAPTAAPSAEKKKIAEPSKEATKKEPSKSAPAETPKIEAKAPSPPKPEEPSKSAAPVASIDPLNVPASNEAAVQDVVKILNDIITVVNADNAAGKYSSAISKAKDEISKVAQSIAALKETEHRAAEAKIQANHTEFDGYAKELLSRVEQEMREQESRWKDEYETERERLSQSYQSKLNTELASARDVYDQKLKNELLEQSVALHRAFADDVATRVETERDGRLGRLAELAKAVQSLEELTADGATVLDRALNTQHLQVALDAVRARLEPSAPAPAPFVTELAALKAAALPTASNDNNDDNAIVAAAVASIPPTAYQRGIPSAAQLIDRFRRVAAEVRKAGLLPAEAGVASHAVSWALSKATFRKEGMPVGDDVESVLARAETWLEEGRLEEAAREVNGLGGTARELCRDWLGECRRVLEVRQALEVVETEARLQSLLVG